MPDDYIADATNALPSSSSNATSTVCCSSLAIDSDQSVSENEGISVGGCSPTEDAANHARSPRSLRDVDSDGRSITSTSCFVTETMPTTSYTRIATAGAFNKLLVVTTFTSDVACVESGACSGDNSSN